MPITNAICGSSVESLRIQVSKLNLGSNPSHTMISFFPENNVMVISYRILLVKHFAQSLKNIINNKMY